MTRQSRALHLAALGATLFGAVASAVAVMLEPGGLAPGQTAVVRAAAALLAVLSGVAAEALMRAHPWAWRATRALAVAWVAVITVLFACLGGSAAAWFWTLACSAVVGVPLVLYVRRHAAGAFQQGARIPRPARRP